MASTSLVRGDLAFSFSMARLLATVTLVGALATPASGAADEIYSFVDGDGVVHYTNVPQDARYRVVIASRASRVQPPLLRRTSHRPPARPNGPAALLRRCVRRTPNGTPW